MPYRFSAVSRYRYFSVQFRRSLLLALLTILAVGTAPAQTPRHQPEHGAMSAKNMAQMAAVKRAGDRADAGPIAADSVCARFSAGAPINAPPELRSQNGRLEVTFQFLSAVDAQGLTRYCYLTDGGHRPVRIPDQHPGTDLDPVTSGADQPGS